MTTWARQFHSIISTADSQILQLLPHPPAADNRPAIQGTVHGCQAAVWADAGPDGAVRSERLV